MKNNWTETTLKLITQEKGIMTDGDWVESKDQDKNGNVSLIQLADIKEGYFLRKSSRRLTSKKAEELNCTFLQKNDILIARMPDPLGRACIYYATEEKAVTVVDVCIIRVDGKKYIPKLIMNFVNSPEFRNKIHALQSGSTRKRISKSNLSTITLKIPSMLEQKKIVLEIDTQFTRLDSAIESLQTIKKKLEVYRKSVLKAAFEGYYSKTELELKEVIVNGIKTKIPLNWNVEPLGNSIKLQGGFAFKSKEYASNGIPIVKIANVQYEDINWSDKTFIEKNRYEEFKDYQLKVDDVLIAMTRPIIKSLSLLKTVVVKEKDLPSLLNQRVGRFLINNPEIDKDFLKYYIFTDFFKMRVIRESSSSQQPNISSKKIEKFDFIIPESVEEQNIIIQNIELQFSIIDNLNKIINASLLKAETLRKSILKSAFEGKLVEVTK